MSDSLILLQASNSTAMFTNIAFMLAIFGVFYFFMIRPQAQKQKEQDTFLDELSKGKDIVTTSGILGRITKIEGDIITLAIDNKSYLRVTKGAISKELTDSIYAPKTNTTKVENA